MKTIVCRLDLGFTRIAGYVLFDSDSKEFQEMTPRMTANLVRAHRVNGLVFDSDGELVPDKNGWNLGNIKIKSGVGNFRDFNTIEPRGEMVYSVVRAMRIDDENVIFEVINNKCARVFYTAKQLAALAQFHWVGGVEIDPENGSITACNGVVLEDISDQQYVFEVGNRVYPVKPMEINIDVDAFEKDHPLTEEESQLLADFGPAIDAFKAEQQEATLEDLFSDAPLGSATEPGAVPESAELADAPKSKKKK